MIGLSDLLGAWRLRREIVDRRAGLDGLFEGQVTFTPDGAGLVQRESGLLRYGNAAPMQATRIYLWRQTGDRLCVLFQDDRDFHDFVPAAEVAARHYCAPDMYEVAYEFSAWPDWVSTWRITGPRKDLILCNRFSREA